MIFVQVFIATDSICLSIIRSAKMNILKIRFSFLITYHLKTTNISNEQQHDQCFDGICSYPQNKVKAGFVNERYISRQKFGIVDQLLVAPMVFLVLEDRCGFAHEIFVIHGTKKGTLFLIFRFQPEHTRQFYQLYYWKIQILKVLQKMDQLFLVQSSISRLSLE